MARFEITGPDGAKYEVTAPDDASDEQVMQFFRSQLGQQQAEPEKPRVSAGQMGADVAKSFGTGVAQGVIGMGTLPGTVEQLGRAALDYGADLVGLQSPQLSQPATAADKRTISDTVLDLAGASIMAPFAAPLRMARGKTALSTYDDIKGAAESVTGEFYQPQTTAGQYARTVGEFLPGAAAGPGGLGTRLATQVVGPAVASETAGQLTEGTAAEPYARVAGALAGAHLPNAAVRAVTPAPAEPIRQAAVNALEQHGVNALTAGQRTGSAKLQWLEDATAAMPGGGQRFANQRTRAAEQFTAAALRSAGINAPRALPDVMEGAFQAAEREFQNFGRGMQMRASPAFGQRLGQIVQRYEQAVPESARVPAVRGLATDVYQAAAGPNGLTGEQVTSFRSTLRRLQRGLKNDPQASRALGELVNAYDRQLAAGLPQAQRRQFLAQLQDMNTRYRNLLAIEDAAAASAGEKGAEGLLSPQALKAAAKKQNKRDYVRGRGDLGNLARAGEMVLRPLNSSGTAERSQAQRMLAAPASVIGYATMADPVGAIVGAVAPAAAGAATSRAVMNPLMQRYLANQRLMQGVPIGDQTISRALLARYLAEQPEGDQ